MKSVRLRSTDIIKALPLDQWAVLFRPKVRELVAPIEIAEFRCDLADRYLFYRSIEDDWRQIVDSDASCVWTAIQNVTDIYLVEGVYESSAVAYLLTEIGWDADNAFQVDVRTGNEMYSSVLELLPVSCDHGCQTFNNPIKAYFSEGIFSHWYCSWCGDTCRN